MALVLADRVQETTATTGTGDITLGGAVAGYQSFAVVGNGNTCYYTIVNNSAWEVGIGTYSTTGPALARTTVLSNSNGNTSPLALSGASSVFLTYPAEKSVNLDASGNVSPLGTVTSGVWNGSTVGVAYGGTGVTASSGANSVVLRDANQNVAFNNFTAGATATTASAGTTVLTVASARTQILVGSTTHTFKLPDATTMALGQSFIFVNNSSGALNVINNASATVEMVPSGGITQLGAVNIATSAGSWGAYSFIPAAVNWGTNSLDLATTVISGGTWNGGVIAGSYGGTGLSTFVAANNAIYSTGATTLTAGTLPVAAGGTGVTSLTAGYIPYGNGSSYASSSSLQFVGGVLVVGGASVLGGATNPITAFTGSANNYIQTYVYNQSTGTSASADFVAYTDNSTDAHGWADIGFTSSTYADPVYTVTGPNEAYVLGSALNSSFTGNLVYATDYTGSQNAHQWYVGGFTQAKSAWKMQLTSTGLQLANALGVAYGGTGSTSLTANNVLLGNGTSALQKVAPGTSGNVLTSNGTTWVSQAFSGGVASLTGTASQINVSASTGAVTLSLPASINVNTSGSSASCTGNSATATSATNATFATSASSATNATFATSAGSATNAGAATNAGYATNAGSATNATTATNVNGGSARIATINGTDQMIENVYGAYLHMGAWGVDRTNAGAVLVNTAFMADSATNAGYATYANSAGSASNAGYAGYAGSAGRAYPYRVGGVDLNFNWSGQGGQPSWLWGGNDGSNMYVYNPSNFSVSYAGSAGYAGYAGSAGSASNAGYASTAGSLSGGSNSGNGWARLGNSAIIQWGSYTSATGTATISLPTSFPNACTSAICTLTGTTVTAYQCTNQSRSTTQIQFWQQGSGTFNFNWIALGY